MPAGEAGGMMQGGAGVSDMTYQYQFSKQVRGRTWATLQVGYPIRTCY